MTISKELFLAVLSMDAYNRGYDPRINGLNDGIDTAIGSASIFRRLQDVSPDFTTQAQAAGFYAVAYELTAAVGDMAAGTVVISYRGTDQLSDVWTGWTTSLGVPPAQSLEATQFYHSVRTAIETQAAANNEPVPDLVLTGHSLGGALAGFVANLFSEEAVLYDNIPFENSSNSLQQAAADTDGQALRDAFYEGQTPPATNNSQIVTHAVPGEVAALTRGGQSTPQNDVGSQSASDNLAAVPDFADWTYYLPGGPIAGRAANLHWQSK